MGKQGICCLLLPSIKTQPVLTFFPNQPNHTQQPNCNMEFPNFVVTEPELFHTVSFPAGEDNPAPTAGRVSATFSTVIPIGPVGPYTAATAAAAAAAFVIGTTCVASAGPEERTRQPFLFFKEEDGENSMSPTSEGGSLLSKKITMYYGYNGKEKLELMVKSEKDIGDLQMDIAKEFALFYVASKAMDVGHGGYRAYDSTRAGLKMLPSFFGGANGKLKDDFILRCHGKGTGQKGLEKKLKNDLIFRYPGEAMWHKEWEKKQCGISNVEPRRMTSSFNTHQIQSFADFWV